MVTLFGTFLMVILILAAAFWCTRYIGKVAGARQQSGYMEVLDQLVLGSDRSILIVQVGTKRYLMGVTSEQIQILGEIDEELIPVPKTPVSFGKTDVLQNLDFQDILDKMRRGKKRR